MARKISIGVRGRTTTVIEAADAPATPHADETPVHANN